MNLKRPLLVLVCLFAVCTYRSMGQGTTATVLGVVSDTSGSAIPDASVVIKNVGTGTSQTLSTDALGRYRFSDLPVGDYELQSSKTGFNTVVRRGVTLTVGSENVVDFALGVGAQQQTITVEGQATQVETTSATVGALTDQRQMRELPLNGRNFEQLIQLAPGVQLITSVAPNARQGAAKSFSGAGSRPENQALLLDDEDIQNFYRRGLGTVTGSSLGVEAIAEFQTLTNTYGAQFGGNGVVINSVSKSGTNSYHGSIYDFLRNSALDSRNFFDPGSSPPSFRKNQYGGSLGGPVLKNKLFFFANYEGIRQFLGETKIATVPDASHRTAASSVTNPATAQAINATLALFPLPTSNFNTVAGTGQITEVAGQTAHEDYGLGRVDYNISDKDTFFLRYFIDKQYVLEPFPVSGSLLPYWPEIDEGTNQFMTAEWKRILSPTLLNTARVSYSRPQTVATPTGSSPVLQFYPGSGRPDGLVGITGLTSVGVSTFDPSAQVQNRFTEADDIVRTRGAHTWRFGASITRQQSNVFFPYRSGSNWNFQSLQNFQQGIAQTVVGTPLGSQYYPYRSYRETDFTPYVQDDWKVTAKLTLNLGLRWELTTNPTDAKNAFYTVTDFVHGTQLVNVPNATKDNPSWWNLDPRVGFAYDLFADHKAALRGGFGITHSPYFPGNYNSSYTGSKPWDSLQQTNPTYPIPFSAISASLPTISPGWNWYNNRTPYLIQYNLNVQREIASGTVLSVGYVGSHGVDLLTQQEANPPLYTIDQTNVYHFSSTRVNPALSVLALAVPGTTSRYNSLQANVNRRFSSNVQAQVAYTYSNCIDDGGSPVGSLNGGNSPTNYSNPYDRSVDRGLCYFNVKNTLRVNGLIALPFHGNRFVEGWQLTGILSANTGLPFSVSTGFDRVGYLGSGTPRPNYAPNNPALTSGNVSLPACNNNPALHTVGLWFNPNCFALEDQGTLGNVGRDNVIGPGLVNVDFAILKDTKVTEAVRAQIRAEFFNVFNHANFGLPAASVFTASGLNSTAGQITSTVTTSRQIQFGLKILF